KIRCLTTWLRPKMRRTILAETRQINRPSALPRTAGKRGGRDAVHLSQQRGRPSPTTLRRFDLPGPTTRVRPTPSRRRARPVTPRESRQRGASPRAAQCIPPENTMAYRAPVQDIIFTLKHAAGFAAARAEGLYLDLGDDDLDAVLGEAGRFASEVLAPLNAPGDRYGTPFRDGVVTTPPGWKEAYRDWAAAGWNGVAASAEWGGQGLPRAVNAACIEMWNSASMAFGLGPVLTMAAVDSLAAFGGEDLKKTYLPKLVSGEWMGTMQLTEPQAGSDVGALRTRAERAHDGSYRITGSKIFITYGEHDLTENIVHFVLARIGGAPDGTKGLSLFLIPKFLVGPEGQLGDRNDLRANRIEHKLGLHASPTCHMVYGDNGGCVGYLVGEENRGIAGMVTMMNEGRPAVRSEERGVGEE